MKNNILIVNHPESIDGRAALRSASITNRLFNPFHPEDAVKAINKATQAQYAATRNNL